MKEICQKRLRSDKKTQIVILWTVLFTWLFVSLIHAQGISRSTGLGLRGGFWKINGQSIGVRVGTSGNSDVVDVAGAGGSLLFFSRLHQNWFLETNLGSVANVHVEEEGLFDENVNVSVVIPFTVGVRFDFLSGQKQTSIVPYVSGGLGTYWLVNTSVEEQGLYDSEVQNTNDFYYGGTVGAGSFLTLSDWIALNFDTRYHFVDFSTDNEKSGFEFSLGFCFMWGRKQEIFEVQAVRVIVEDIYPAYYRFYNTYPLAMATIQNTAGHPIEVNLRSWIDGYTEGVRQSGFIEIPKGQSRDIPVYLLFGPELLQSETREPAVIDLQVEARPGVTVHKSFSAQVVVHSRNAWNGDIDKLTVFVIPDDPKILGFTRNTIKKDTTETTHLVQKFHQAQLLFNALGENGLRYQSDPNIPFDRDDRVQFAPTTLSLGTGDCDDLVVLYASLLESVGISTAFIDVQDPKTQLGHVYLIFNTDIKPEQSQLISSNEKRYIIRETASGSSTLWIPVETTLVQDGFETAWKVGATKYLEQGVLRHGLDEGWIKIVDVK